jgi:hypothetical protein
MKKPDRRQAKSDFFDTAETSTDSTTPAKFAGTDNPRHLRAIHALNTRPMPREHLDRAAGCSNGPELVAELRRRGLEVPCQRVSDTDRDGLPIRRGVYHFTEKDRRKLATWRRLRQKGGIDLTLAGLLTLATVCAFMLAGVL